MGTPKPAQKGRVFLPIRALSPDLHPMPTVSRENYPLLLHGSERILSRLWGNGHDLEKMRLTGQTTLARLLRSSRGQ